MIVKAITGLFKGIKRPWQVSEWCGVVGRIKNAARVCCCAAPLLLLLSLLSLLHHAHPSFAAAFYTHAFPHTTNNQQITGLTSTSDFLEYLPLADEYRKHSPGCALRLRCAAFCVRGQHCSAERRDERTIFQPRIFVVDISCWRSALV